MTSRGIIHNNEDLRKLIIENPDLPIAVLVSDTANTGDYNWQYCSSIKCSIKEVLDCETPFEDNYVYSDKYEFEEDLTGYLTSLPASQAMTIEEFVEWVEQEIDNYKPYWKKVIAIYADN